MAENFSVTDRKMAKVNGNGQPVNILEIMTVRGQTKKKSKYSLKKNELQKLLDPIKNMEVVVIAAVGTSRRGKSFLLNYMWRFLEDYKNINGWMGDGNKPLEGFGWKSSEDPQTFGLWLSKPFIVKQSNGKEIAVLLMDTQGLFDDAYEQRDWSTIVGISLLVSSCLIVNVFTDISEDILQTMDSYIEYGLRANENNTENNESIPFQTLLFLIRDWNTPNVYKFGMSGGKQYLEKKLIVRDNQSISAQNVRKNMGKCFKDILCFLMPPFGEAMENPNFDGSYDQLRDRFREKLKEFISTLLNPEELVPKMIDGTPITGRELCQHFQSYIEIFNKEEMPESKHIIEAKALLSDNNKIRNLKENHLNNLRTFMQNKPFITRNELREQNNVYKTEIIEDFETSMKSNNTKLVDQLIDDLKKIYEFIYRENEVKRETFMETKRDLCLKEFNDVLMDQLKDNGFMDPEEMEKMFKNLEERVFNSYKQCYGGEDEKLFEKGLFELNRLSYDYERAARIENYRRIKEFEKTKDEYISKVVDFYNENMQKLLNDNKYLDKKQFKESELIVKNKTTSKFRNIYIFENPSANETFYLKVDQKLKESKLFFKEKNKTKCNEVIEETAKIVLTAIEGYKKELNERLYLINSLEDLEKSHQLVLSRASEDMQNKLPFKAPFFITKYIETFDTEINKLYESYRTQLSDKIETINKKFSDAFTEAKDYYKDGMNNAMEEKGFLSAKDLSSNHRTLRRTALRLYENHFEDNKDKRDPLFRSYQSDLRDFIDEEYQNFVEKNEENQNSEETVVQTLINDSINTFNTQINELIDNSITEEQLSTHYTILKEELKTQLLDNNTVTNKGLLNQNLFQFDSDLSRSYGSIREKLKSKKTSIMKDYDNKMADALFQYKQRMNQMLEKEEYVTDEELLEFHEKTKTVVMSELKSYLKPLYEIDVNNYIENTEGVIDEEYKRYDVVNESILNNRREQVFNDSKKYIKEYDIKMNENFNSIQTEEELSSKHSKTLHKILEKSRNAKTFSNEKLISLQISYIESQVSTLFEQISSKYREKVGIYSEAFESILDSSKAYYINEMDSLFANNEFYLKEKLEKHLSGVKSRAFSHFESHMNDSEASFPHIKKSYLEQLNRFIENSSTTYTQKNEENKYSFDLTLKDKVKSFKQKYSKTMNSSIDTILSEEELNTKHYELMTQLLSEFNESENLLDVTLLEPYQQSLQEYMNTELTNFMNKVKAKVEDIVNSYEKLSLLLIEQYSQEMENINISESIFTDEHFEGLNTIHSTDAIDLFNKHLNENPCSDAKNYLIKLKAKIDEEYLRLRQRFIEKQNLKLKNLEIVIKQFGDMYINDMKENQKSVDSMEKLKDCHQTAKERLVRVFKETHHFSEEEQLLPYIERIEDMFDNSFIDFETILDLKLEKLKNQSLSLKRDIRNYYRDEMNKFFQNKRYIPQTFLNKYHKLTVRNTIEKFTPEKGEMSEETLKLLVVESIEDLFKKLDEDNQTNKPTESPAIGIDLGTTNSCAAVYEPNLRNISNVFVIPNEFGHPTTPSVVSYRDNSITCVGEVAKDEIHSYPRNTISSVKRLIGRHYNEESVQNDMNLWSYKVVDDGNNNPKVNIKVDGQDIDLYPEQVSAKVLKKMKEIAESHLGCEVTKAVITVPAYFNDGQKEATKDAGRLAGLDVLRIINEPTAAAIAFKVDRNEETDIRNVLIYDFGGGTFDVSILEINRGQINVKAVGGDNHLGGDDIDTNLIKYCLDQFFNDFNVTLEGHEGESAMCRLRNKCEEAKKKLTSVESTILSIQGFYQSHDLRVVLMRDKFEELNYSLFLRSIDLVKKTLDDIRMSPSDINDVVLVGGTTRVPKVQEMLREFFGDRPLNHWVNPDEAVAKGAAIQAALLNGGQQLEGSTELELKDVTPLSLGIRIKGGKMSVIVPRNTSVPNSVTKQYYTSEDYQTVVSIKIFEGEKENTVDNNLLGQFDLGGIPRALQGEQPIDVTFNLNDEGILKVNAKIVSTGGEKEIEITEHKGRLTTEMIEQLLEQENGFTLLYNN